MKLLKWIKSLFIKTKKVEPKYNFGWVKDTPDPRDLKFKIEMPHALPASVDLRPTMPAVYNQGNIGSCVGNGVAAAFQFEQIKQKKKDFIPSRLFIYFGARKIEGTENEDAGCMVRDGVKVTVDSGVCPETMWQYIESKFKDKPTDNCFKEALNNQVLKYLRISPHNLYEVKHCLSDGYPIIFGFSVYESFMSAETAKTGIAKMPQPNEQSIGGHCAVICGYSDEKQALLVRNSWGDQWGLKGYFWLPYGYVTTDGLSNDYWTIRLVE